MNSGAETSPFAAARVLPEWAEAQFAALQTELAASERQRLEQAGEIQRRDLKIQQLTLELAYYRRIKFGTKSESLSVEQQDLFLESCNEDQAAISAELAQVQGATEKSQPKPTGRKAIPPDLPRIDHRHEPASCTCGHCGADLIKIGEDISEQLDVEPARFFVHRHIRPQYACRTRPLRSIHGRCSVTPWDDLVRNTRSVGLLSNVGRKMNR